MTEDEAKKKWCPLVRYKFSSESDRPSCNRDIFSKGVMEDGTRCIASECMAWRWRVDYDNGYCGAFGLPGHM